MKMKLIYSLICSLILIFLTACTQKEVAETPVFNVETAVVELTQTIVLPTETLVVVEMVEQVLPTETSAVIESTETVLVETPTPTDVPHDWTPTPDTRIPARQWTSWPVVPRVSPRAVEIYQQGLAMGNHARVFSKVGDCQSVPNVFLGIYETNRYALNTDEQYLQETIDRFVGSFSHESQAVKEGVSPSTVLSQFWTDLEYCDPDENMLTCELRLSKPSIMFINLGTNWRKGASADEYEKYLRQIIEVVIENGSVPILSTKADNVEGDYSINAATARVAYDYDIPLWNFWVAADSLPGHGLDGSRDGIYLTPDGWDVRNKTGLKVLDAVWRALESPQDN